MYMVYFRSISPLFASLCSSRVITSHVNKYISNTPTMLQWLAHLVDKGKWGYESGYCHNLFIAIVPIMLTYLWQYCTKHGKNIGNES